MKKSKKQKLKRKVAKIQEAESSQMEKEKQLEHLNSLMEEAEASMDIFNYEEAELKLKEILSIDQNNVKALEMLSSVKIENCDWTESQTLLKKCIELESEKGFSKYFSMAQLSDGLESLGFYQKGIQIVEKELENLENVEPTKEKDIKSLTRTLSDAYCSISEIFMTDCCFEEDAEGKCFNAIQSALKADSTNPEAYQCLSNFHLVKENVPEAKQAIEKCISLWLPQHEAFRDGEIKSEIIENIPTYESRIKISKLLIELEMFDEATKILDGLLEEQDEVVEVWYLLGWLNYIQGHEYKLNAHYYLKKAKKIGIKMGMSDVDYFDHIIELLEELSSLVSDEDSEEEVEDDGDDNWEECLSSSSENEQEMETCS